MKIILNKDVEKLGQRDDIVEVSVGYARNYLLPKKLAVKADSGMLKSLDKRMKAKAVLIEKAKEGYRQMADKLDNLSVEVKVDAGEEGKLFGSVTSHDISVAIKELIGLDIDKKQVLLTEPVKALGKKDVKIKFTSDITATISLLVSPKK